MSSAHQQQTHLFCSKDREISIYSPQTKTQVIQYSGKDRKVIAYMQAVTVSLLGNAAKFGDGWWGKGLAGL